MFLKIPKINLKKAAVNPEIKVMIPYKMLNILLYYP